MLNKTIWLMWSVLAPVVVWAQTVTMVVGTAAGSSSDMAARRMGAQAANVLGESWVVSNVVGGGGVHARRGFDMRPAQETLLVLSDVAADGGALQGLSPVATILTQSFALVGRAGVRRPTVISHAYGEGTRARALAETIARALQATAVPYKGNVLAIFDAKQHGDSWVLVEGAGADTAQREGLEVFAVGDKSLGLTNGYGQASGSGAQSFPSFADLLGQPIPAARATTSVYVQATGAQPLVTKLARLGLPEAGQRVAHPLSRLPRCSRALATTPKPVGAVRG